MPATPHQIPLFDSGATAIDATFAGIERRELGRGAWLDVLPGWVRGSHRQFEELLDGVDWQTYQMKMYDRVVDQPRLSARLDKEAWDAEWPLLAEMARALGARYREELRSCWLNLYRDGSDSVAWHGDRHGRRQNEALVADVSLGYPRRFRIRAKEGGPSLGFDLGHGDLLVMGGTCQRTFEHSVPKVAFAEPRISITFRPWEAK